jgi:phage regulator Rha-like protein
MKDTMSSDTSLVTIEEQIHFIRGRRVVLSSDLAKFYGVSAKRLNEQVKRNKDRFPKDFLFQLTDQEVNSLKSQNATLEKGKGQHAKYLPFAFTEHGAVMAANVLNSPVAIEASILIVRAFIRMREVIYEHSDLKKRLQEIEGRLAKGFAAHEQELQEIRFLISQLEQPIERNKRPIGFK